MNNHLPIIYLEATDELSHAIQKLERIKAPVFTIAIPKGAVLMHSPLNLKILKRYLDSQNRTAYLAIADQIGSTFATDAGFDLAAAAPDPDLAEVFNNNEPTLPEISIEDHVTIDDLEPDLPSPSPFIKRGLGLSKVLPAMRPPQLTNFRLRLSRQHKLTIGIIAVGLAILASVSYFVIPKATVTLEVQSEPFKKQFALILADEQDLQAAGANILTGRFLEVSRENVTTFQATGEKNNGQKAEGQITVFNHTGSIAGLLANTRFKTADGLIFRIKTDALVSPARNRVPGKVTVAAVADEGGTKYNIAAGVKLTVPGLGANAQELVYGQAAGSFANGTDEITKVVSQEDIDQAKEEAAKNVFAAAEAELQKQLKRSEEIINSFIQNDVVDAIPSVTAGAIQDQFEVRVQSRSWVIAIPKGRLKSAVFNAALNEVPEGRQITQQTADTAKTEVVEGNFLTHRINLLVSVDGRIGPQLNTDELVTRLSNQPEPAGQAYLQSLTEVASSSITIWPNWINRIPLLRNNIKVQVIYLGE